MGWCLPPPLRCRAGPLAGFPALGTALRVALIPPAAEAVSTAGVAGRAPQRIEDRVLGWRSCGCRLRDWRGRTWGCCAAGIADDGWIGRPQQAHLRAQPLVFAQEPLLVGEQGLEPLLEFALEDLRQFLQKLLHRFQLSAGAG